MYSFPDLEPVCCFMSGSNCCFLILYGGLVFPSHKNFPWFVVIHTVKGFSGVNEAEVVGVFWEFPCFFYDPTDVGNLISGKSSLNIWKFSVHILLKHSLENFEDYLASMWNECNCVVVWAFFGIAFLWDWSENWPFPVSATAEFSKFADILTDALLQHHFLLFEIAHLESHHLH